MKLKKWSLLLDVTIQDVLNVPNAQDPWISHLAMLDKMKKTAFLINTSRGQIINEDDLIIALSTNEIAGAGLDVFEKEPLPENNKLRFLPNALLTPHIGYVTAENYSMYYYGFKPKLIS